MSGQFTIETDKGRNMLRVAMSGFFTVECVGRYRAAIDAVTAELGGPPDAQVMTNDISAMTIQSQDIVDAFRAVMADPRYAERRVGFVVPSTLARVQLSRVIGSRTAQMFATAEEAEAWLFGRDSLAA